MTPLLGEKSVVITGAGSGIGRASAELFAREGAHVVCADLREPWADETAHRIKEAGGTALAVPCDVVVAEDVEKAIAVAVAEFGRLDVMFNNAGISTPREGMRIEEHTTEDFDRLVAVNGRGVFYGCRAAVCRFKEQGDGGVIVNTASIAGLVGIAGSVYGATKAMVIQLTRAVAIEGASSGIRANCICPGGLPTTNFGRPAEAAFAEPTTEAMDAGLAMHPLGRLIQPDDCAAAALYLASDLAVNVTGVALPVDGGFVAR